MKFRYPFLVFYFALAVQTGLAQNTYVPDNNFEQALIDLGYDDTLDDYVLTASISGVTDLDVQTKEISDLTGIEAFTALTSLTCVFNDLTSLDLSSNTALTTLSCNHNQLTSLDVSANTALTYLSCYDNQLTSLDVSANTALTELNCFVNQLTSLDVSTNTALTSLDCNSNQLTSLNVTVNTVLTDFRIGWNPLTGLDLSSNTALTHLEVQDAQLTTLDVSNNTALDYLECYNNQLTSLDVSSNTALTQLYCINNQLTTLDVSNNTALTAFNCSNNQLTTLDVSNNTALTNLGCYSNQLTSLDVSSNTALSNLECGDNQLTTLDISNNTALNNLSCNTNQLTSLNVSSNTALDILNCYSNQLTSLDVSINTALTQLRFYSNQITEIDLSSNTAIGNLECGSNQLTSLDVSSNTALTSLACQNNQLTYLNMKNGLTEQVTDFNATSNSLTCIETLDPDYATANWTSANGNIDAGVTFADICYASNPSYTNVPDDNFEQALIDLSYDDTLDDYVLTANISGVTELNISYEEISDLTGIEGFTAITILECNYNSLTSLDLSSNTALTELHCSFNQLTSLDVTNNTALTYLNLLDQGHSQIGMTTLTSLDVTNNTALTYLNTANAGLTSLDVSSNTALTYLSCSINSSAGLDVSNNTALTYLACSYSQLTSLDVSANTALERLNCRQNQLTSLDVSANTALTELNCHNNNLTSLDVSANTSLTELNCHINSLTSLDVSANTSLTSLTCYMNDITSLDVSNITGLLYLKANSNELSSLDISNNPNLVAVGCSNNNLTSLDVSNNPLLTEIECGGDDNQQFASLDVSNNTSLYKLTCTNLGLTILDVSTNTNLHILQCQQNSLTSLDVSSNTELTELNCSDNQLTSLDVSASADLENLHAHDNSLTSLDLTNNAELFSLYIAENNLTSLDVSNNTALQTFSCYNNQLSSLDVSNNIALTYFQLHGNQLAILDLSSNTALTRVAIESNQLTYLNMKNGLTDQLTQFKATDNSFTCIETLDPVYATANWTSANDNIDAGVTFDVICGAAARTNWHVATTGSDITGSGTLASPLSSIQTAINATTVGDTVSVAAGTYVENINFNGKNIAVIGADSSNTIIDGDSSGSVVVINGGEDSTAVLKNFTITNGNGDGYWREDEASQNGGGIFLHQNSSPTLRNLSIRGNIANARGGGIYLYNNCEPLIINSTISNNTSFGAGGGGIFMNIESSPTFENVQIIGNTSSGGPGGGVLIFGGGSPIMNNMIISNNSGTDGGGIHVQSYDGTPSLTISSSTISNNLASYGGGINLSSANTVTISECIITNNTASTSGGGINSVSTDVAITNSTISNNTAANVTGGGISLWSTTATLENVAVIDNKIIETNDIGTGGIYCQNSSPTLSNVTVAGNTSDHSGGLYCQDNSNPIIVNSILWNNASNEITFRQDGDDNSLTTAYSNIRGGAGNVDMNGNGSVEWLAGNLNIYPTFADTANGDYTLSDTSPCISAGASSVTIGSTTYTAPTTDLAGNARPSPAGTVPDIGVYENSNGVVSYSGDSYYVSASSNYGNGSSTYPFPAIQQGIDASSSGDTVSVAAGTYYESIDFNGKNIAVIGESNETTIIDGDSTAIHVVSIHNGETENALLKNFTIQNGYAYGQGGWPNDIGGGIAVWNGSTPTLSYLNVINNYASEGGGIACFDGGLNTYTLSITDNSSVGKGGGMIIHNSTANLSYTNPIGNNGGDGAGLNINQSDVKMVNSYIGGNQSTGAGGGIYVNDSDVDFRTLHVYANSADAAAGIECNNQSNMILAYSEIRNNSANCDGGGFVISNTSTATITNSTINNNSAGCNGGGVRSDDASKLTLANVTMSGNSANGDGSGIFTRRDNHVKLFNTIIWGAADQDIYLSNADNSRDTITVAYSDIKGGQSSVFSNDIGVVYWQSGNIDTDPLFFGSGGPDDPFTLAAGSPAIDVGNPNAFYNDDDSTRNDMGYTGGNGFVLSATEIDFGYLGLGDSRNKTITITNLNPHDIAITGASFDDSQFTTSQSFPLNMSYYSTADIQFTFTPTTIGAQSGTLQLSSPDIPPPPNTYGEFALSGNAFDLSDGVVQVPGEVPTIQEAIDASSNGDTVLVAAGTYYENLNIYLKSIALIGVDSATTILDGGNNGRILRLNNDRNYGTSLVKGFTIKNGNQSSGGAIQISNSYAVLDGLQIIDNYSGSDGGAIWAWEWLGTLKNSVVKNNLTEQNGAIDLNGSSDVTINGVDINDNTAQGVGGGMYIENGSSVTMDNVGFSYNTSGEGGAIVSEGPIFARNCLFTGNSAGRGGAVRLLNNTNPESMFFNCHFRSNTATQKGGAVQCTNGTDALFFGCRFFGNSAGSTGGAIAVTHDASPQIINTTIAGNTAGQAGGGIYYNIEWPSLAKIENSIIWGNSPDMISFEDNPWQESYVSIQYSDIQNGLAGITNREDHNLTWGDGNISEDPLFPSDWETNGTLTLAYGSGSPAINAGNPNGFYNDEDWEPNTDGPRNDMGANGGNGIYISSEEVDFGDVGVGNGETIWRYIYNLKNYEIDLESYSSSDAQFNISNEPEIPHSLEPYEKFGINIGIIPTVAGALSGTIEISFSNLSNNNGTFSATAMAYNVPSGDIHVPADASTIQTAVDIAPSGKTIVVAPGEYFENIIAKSDISLTSSGGPLQTIINGNNEGVVIEGHNDIAYNFTLDGFTITGGNGAYYEHGISAMILGHGSTLRNLIITGNTGGGNVIQVEPAETLIENVAIFNNEEVNATNPSNYDAAVYIYGGGNDNEYCVIKNVTIANNEGMYGISYDGIENEQDLNIINSVIWNNQQQDETAQIVFGHGPNNPSYNINVRNSLVEGGASAISYSSEGQNNASVQWDSSNLTSYPYFNDPDNGDYSLSSYSPMIGSGAMSVTIEGVTYDAPTTDVLGTARPNPAGTSPDIGAYESSESVADYNPHKYVTTTGDNSSPGTLDLPYLTIQYAIDQAQDDDIIHVAAGTYVENINFNGKNISVIGENRETTIIDGNQSGIVVVFGSGVTQDALLKNFSIINGNASSEGISSQGGGILCYSSTGVQIDAGSPTLENLVIRDNYAENYGGGISMNGAVTSYLKNILVVNNHAGELGGGIHVQNDRQPQLENVTVVNNSATNGAGGMIVSSAVAVSVVNSFIGNNNPPQIQFDPYNNSGGSSTISFSYSSITDTIVYPNNGTINWVSSNIDVEPMFVDTANGNYHLLASSQLINAGHPDSTDSDGTRVDIGAYTYLNTYTGPTWYVQTDGSDTDGTGASATPFASIQSAINFATTTGDSVTVAAGTYVGTVVFSTNHTSKVIKVVGQGPETTVINGDSAKHVININSDVFPNLNLSGFTIKNGYASGGENWEDGHGGGIRSRGGNNIFENLVIEDNYATSSGGGIFCFGSTVTLKNIVFRNNYGSSIGAWNSVYVENCLFESDNDTHYALDLLGSSETSHTLINITVTNYEYGVYIQEVNARIINSILWNNNSIALVGNSGNNDSTTIYVSNSLVNGGEDGISINDPNNETSITWLTNNIDVNPAFVDSANGDYHLSDLSPAIGAGTASITIDDVTYTAPTTDLDGNPRPNPAGTLPDVGAYESDMGVDPNYAGPVWYVDGPAGLPYGNGGPGAPFTTIQAGIDASSAGDTVSVKAGTYVENINFNGKNIALIGEDRETTIIDGDSSGSVVMFGNGEDSSALLNNFTIQNGSATNGGGIYCLANSSPTLTDLIILNNSAGSGGGMMLYNFSNPLIKNVIFKGNSVTSNGSALFCWARSSPTIRNSIFEGNVADGAVIYSEDRSDPTFINVTITGNTVDNYNSTYTAAVYASGGSAEDSMKVRFLNSVIFNEGTAQIKATGDYNRIDISYSNVLHGQDSVIVDSLVATGIAQVNWGSGNIDVDPMFVDTANGNYHLLASSQLINAGHPDSTDSDGTIADIGAYPYLNSYSGPTWYISTSGNNTTATGAADDPFKSIQAGINFSSSGDSVTVAAGTYVENIHFPGKNIDVIGADQETTIIDGDSSGSVVTFSSWQSSTTVFSGFTIQNGNNNDGGGGIFVDGTSPTLNNLIIKNNSAISNGAGIYISNSSLLLKNSIIKDNSSVLASGVHIENTSYATIMNVEITGNNLAHGSTIWVSGSYPIFSNTTITNNESSINNNEKGIELYNTANVTLINSIITGQNNAPIYFNGSNLDYPSFITISYSLIEGGQDSIVTNDNGTVTWGDGNIDVDPMFVDTANGNYHLLASSQLINAGHPDSTDADGTIADIGAYPYLNSYSGPTWHITEAGNDTTATGSSADPFRSIQAGINFSSHADSVAVAAGTYVENVNFRGRNIKVVGADRETTIIDGNQSGSVVIFESGESNSALLSGFTITNGTGTLDGYLLGGGVYSHNSSPTLKNLIVTNNTALGSSSTGGGIRIGGNGSPVLENLLITENHAQETGGLSTGGNALIRDTKIISNYSENAQSGGLSTGGGGTIDLHNVLIADNQVLGQNLEAAGGVSLNGGTTNMVNVTITNNLGREGIYIQGAANLNITNSIIFGNNGREIVFRPIGGVSPFSYATINYSNIENGLDSIATNDNGTVTWGSGNIDSDPAFIDTANGNYHLLASSQLINAGHPDSLDSDSSRADIGAYPYLNSYSGPTWYITESGNDTTATGASGDPFASIQAAINFATTAGDSVTVAAGTYVENINFRGRNIKVVGADRETTIIDGDSSGSVVTFENGEDSTAVLKNFTITNGNANTGDWPNNAGAGVLIYNYSSPTLRNLIVTNNYASFGGGGIEINTYCNPLLDNVTINQNSASRGAGLSVQEGSNPEIKNTIISNNQIDNDGSGLWGGGVCIESLSNPTFENVQITGNTAYTGGGVYINNQCSPTFENVQITGNTANSNGGGIYAENSSFTLDNVTVSNNTSTGDDPQISEAGGISVSTENGSSNNHIRIVNSIISSNTASGGSSTGGLLIFNIDSVTIASTEINGNSGMYTGGLYTNQLNYFNMSSSLVAENTGLYYGGVSFLATANENPAQITSCTITDNSYTNIGAVDNASDLMVERLAFVSILNSIIASQQSPGITVGNYDSNESSELTIGYSLISDGQDSINVYDYGTLIWGDGNINVDPMFADTANGDYNLTVDSRLIDAGHPDSTDADGTRADMGAYYYNQTGQPTRVTDLISTPSASNIELAWSANTAASTYNIYRSTDAAADFYSATPFSTTSTASLIDSSVSVASTYYYRIGAVDSEGDEGLLAFSNHGRLGSDSTSLYLQDTYLTHTTGSGLDDGSSYTLEAFVRFPVFPADSINFMSIGSEAVQLVPLENDQARIDLHLSGTDHEGATIADTSWHHVALTTDGSTSTLWVDGYAAVTAAAGFGANGKILIFGNSASISLSIRIDAARLSNSVRYSSGFIPVAGFSVDANTLGYWAFDEGSTDVQTPATYDRSGNGLHLSIEHEGSDVVAWYDGVPVVDISSSPLVINEIMQNPSEVSDPQGEWIEIHNTYFTPLHLKDYVLSDDGSDAHTIATDVVVPVGGYAVLASNADTTTNAGLITNYEFSGFSLGNSNDEVLLSDPNGTEIDRVAYDNGTTFPDPSGASMELIAPHYDNALGNSWAAAVAEYGAGDLGSPGRRNDAFSGAIVLSDTAFSFGGVVEENELDQTLYISNTGVRTLTISAINSTLDQFTISASSAVLPIGDTLGIVITFTPTGPGLYQDTMLVASDDPVNPLIIIPLTGLGISEEADITVSSTNSDSLAVFGFPLTRIGSPRTITFSVSNIGAEDLEVDEITFTGDTEGFTVSQSNLYLELYDTVWVEVTFDPPVNGPYAATLVMTSNDPDEALYNIAFTGTGSQYIIFEVPGEIPTIQAALDTALAGDTVNVAAGTYGGGLVFPPNDLVLRGVDAETTILNGGDSSVVLTINSGQTAASIISGLTIRGGLGTNGGGLVIDDGSSPIFKEMIFYDNAATQGAALYLNSFSSPTVAWSIFVVNSASSGQGAGIAIAGGSSVTVTNSIFWANTGTAVEVLSGSADITYSIVEGGNVGTGNLDQNPIFVNPATGDFHLQWSSAAIDAGNPASPLDPDGTVTDMGALYYDQTFQPPDVPGNIAAAAGNGQATISWSVPLDPRGNENSDIDSYVLYSGTAADSLVLQDTIPAADTSYVDNNNDDYLQNGTTYYYYVTAVDTGDLVSVSSDTVSVVPAGGALVLADTTHAFGQVVHDQSGTWNLILTNSGNGVLSIDNIATVTSYFTLSSSSAEIDPEAADTITVTFNPELTSETAYDTISISSDDLYLTLSSITLSGQSIWPVINLSTTSVDYSDVPINTPVEQNVVVYNTGLSDLTLSSIYVDDTDHFDITTGGLVTVGSNPNAGKRPPIEPTKAGRAGEKPPSKDITGAEDVRDLDNRSTGSPSKSTVLDETVLPGDSLVLTIAFVSADTGVFNTDLHIASNDPLGNDDLTVNLSAHATKSEIQVVNTMSVVTYVGNDIPFYVNIENSGGYQLDYTVTADANYFGFEWLDLPQTTGSIPPYGSADLLVNTASTADLDPAGYNGYLYFNTNTGANTQQLIPTDTIAVYMTLLADGSQILDGAVTVPSGNAAPINVTDDTGADMGLMLDFINSSGGSITVTRIDAHPPADSSTDFTDPSGTITDPEYARRYYEINATISGAFAVDIGFDYSTLAGILDPATLRLAKRSLNAGTGEEWSIIPTASTTLNEADGLVVATNQTGFSQWTILSNEGENTFIDMQAPTVASTAVNPTEPGILEDVTVTATINDETGITSADLYYTSGGSAVFTSTAMSGTGSSWSGLIPGSEVSRNGIIYYIAATDPLEYSALSDTFGVAVTFPAGDLTTSSVNGSGYSGGLPIDKWRLLAVPAVLTTATVAGVIGDELGAQSNATWRIFRYDQATSTYKENPNDFTPSEAYWIYQRIEDNLVLTAPGGQTGNMSGTSLSIVPGWSLISSPYPFPIDAALNQTLFYGPITYGVSAESWTDVQTELIPWSGYALYNRTSNNQTVTLNPIASTSGTLARTVQKEGWLMNLAVTAGVYADQFNQLGRIIGAEEGLDHYDNPEILPPGEYLSLAYSLPEYSGKTTFTSDLRSPGTDAALWTVNIRAKGLSETATLSWNQVQPVTGNEVIRIIDRQTRSVVDPQAVSNLSLGRINERFPRVLDLVAGDPAQVEDLVKEILASLPEEFSLKQNYPNPFNPVTTIQFGLPQPANVRLTIVNILGQEVATLINDWRDMGYHQVRWAGVNDQGLPVSTGVYFSILTAGQQVQIRKMLLVK